MAIECFFFWFWVWLLLELRSIKYITTFVSYALIFILLFLVFILSLGFDLLALFTAAVYSSVFIVLSLLALQFSAFWASARPTFIFEHSRAGGVWLVYTFVLASLIFLGGVCFSFELSFFFLWQDFLFNATLGLSSQSVFLHWFFFRCFIVETLGLNLYLFLGLVGVLYFLSLRLYLQETNNVQSHGSTLGDWNQRFRARLVSRIRRATRRTNTSFLRHRIVFLCYLS